jgi:hypothetical protein
MTDAAGTTFTDAMARTARHHELEMWHAAQTVRSHVPSDEGRDDLLDCLGLSDVQRPEGL